MMMANDTGPLPPNAVTEETVEAVRGALDRCLRESGEPTAELRAGLHNMAREARQNAVPPEQLLVILKRIWYAMPQVQNAAPDAEQTRMLQRVVTLCIEQYFAE